MIQILATNTISNTGDRACVPNIYFPELANARTLWLGEESVDPDGLMVVGGGGLFRNDKVLGWMIKSLLSHRGPKVLWGAGLNNDGVGEDDRYPSFLESQFDLIGVRDVVDFFDWCPCVSCMSPLIDKYRSADARTPVVVYHGSEKVTGVRPGMPEAGCEDGKSLSQVLGFLSMGQTVVTSSYHGWYWSTLLGRRVVLVPSAKNSKFFRLPIPTLRAEPGSYWWRLEAEKVQHFPDFLARCRIANREFFSSILRVFRRFF